MIAKMPTHGGRGGIDRLGTQEKKRGSKQLDESSGGSKDVLNCLQHTIEARRVRCVIESRRTDAVETRTSDLADVNRDVGVVGRRGDGELGGVIERGDEMSDEG